jgi:hypothetical protein
MLIMVVNYHPSLQQVAFWGQDTGHCGERRLGHTGREADKFCPDLKLRGISSCVAHDWITTDGSGEPRPIRRRPPPPRAVGNWAQGQRLMSLP